MWLNKNFNTKADSLANNAVKKPTGQFQENNNTYEKSIP